MSKRLNNDIKKNTVILNIEERMLQKRLFCIRKQIDNYEIKRNRLYYELNKIQYELEETNERLQKSWMEFNELYKYLNNIKNKYIIHLPHK